MLGKFSFKKNLRNLSQKFFIESLKMNIEDFFLNVQLIFIQTQKFSTILRHVSLEKKNLKALSYAPLNEFFMII